MGVGQVPAGGSGGQWCCWSPRLAQATGLNAKLSVKGEVKQTWCRWRLSRRWSKAKPTGLGPGGRGGSVESLVFVVPLLDPASELCLGSLVGVCPTWGKPAARARGAHTPPSSPPWDRTSLLLGSSALGASGSRSLLAHPSDAAWPGSPPPPPRELAGRGRGGEGVCGAGGEGAERRGRERTSERARERAGHFCAAPERLGACLGGHWTKGLRDRQTDGSRKPRRRRQVSRARRPSRLLLRPELACWRTCVAEATIRVFAGTCRGPHLWVCVECERACVCGSVQVACTCVCI